MTNVQYKMLEILVERGQQKQFDQSVIHGSNPKVLDSVLAYIKENKLVLYNELTDRNLLKSYALGVSDEDIKIAFAQLKRGGYIEKINPWQIVTGLVIGNENTSYYKITTLGEILQKDEYEFRNNEKILKDLRTEREKELFDYQIKNIESTININEIIANNTKIQTSLSQFTTIFIGVGLVFSVMQYCGIAKVTLQEGSKVEVLPGDISKQIITRVDSASTLDTESHKRVPTMEEVFGKENALPNFKKIQKK